MTREDLVAIFKQGVVIKTKGVPIGRGFFEADLINQLGFTKPELRKLCKEDLIKKVMAPFKNGWRTTYFLAMDRQELNLSVLEGLNGSN